jgi:hypothetical protein
MIGRSVEYHLAHRLGLIGGAGPLAQREQERTLLGLEPRRPIPPRIR